MRVAMITDVHFDVRNGSKYFLDKYQQFFDNVFFPTLVKEGIDTVWLLGDTWEYRTKLNINSMDRAFKMFFDRLEELNIKTYVIYGNHDVVFKNTNEVNSIDFIGKMYPNIHIIKERETIDFDGTPINFMSWVNNSNYEDSIKFIKECPPTVMCGHFEIKSFEMIKGQVCTHGFDKDQFDRFDRVFSGHFHTVSQDGRIFYITNPFQTNWSDCDLDKGFRIFDTKTYELQFITNPYDVYLKLVYDESVDVLDYDYSAAQDKIVRVYIQSYANANTQRLNLFLEKMNRVAYSCEVMEIDDTTYINQETGEIQFFDNRELIEKYIDEVVQNENIDKPYLQSMFTDMYDEAENTVETE